MAKKKTLSERGKFKMNIHKALYKNDDIRELIFDGVAMPEDTNPMTKYKLFQDHVKSHLFIEDTVKEAGTYIFYDVFVPYTRDRTKTVYVDMYLITARSMIDGYIKDGYYGNRIDILCDMVEDTLINDEETVNKFGIGKLEIDSIQLYNGQRFYGCTMRMSVPTFR